MIQYDFTKVPEKSKALLKEWIKERFLLPSNGLTFGNGQSLIWWYGSKMDTGIFNPLELDFFFDEQKIYGRVEIADLDILNYYLNDNWQTPQDMGGTNGSCHSGSLTKLVRHGYAECQDSKSYSDILTKDTIIREPRLTKRGKGSRKFRITEEGKRVSKLK